MAANGDEVGNTIWKVFIDTLPYYERIESKQKFQSKKGNMQHKENEISDISKCSVCQQILSDDLGIIQSSVM